MQEFEWDDEKAASNLVKHGISFDDAKTVFADDAAFIRPDDKHSQTEERFFIIGLASIGHVLIVYFTKRGEKIRLISSRRANENEREKYTSAQFSRR